MLTSAINNRRVTQFHRQTRLLSSSPIVFSGHNRWSKIHRGKAVEDGKKSLRFSKAVNEIILAARRGLDPANNASLASALRNAKSLDVPKDNITAALAKAAGLQGGEGDEARVPSTYEALGPGNYPIIIETMSDNPNRTAKTVRRILKEKGGFTAPVAYAFKKIGKIVLRPRDDATYEQVWDDIIEAGADDLGGEMHPHDPSQTELDVTVDPEQLKSVSLALSSSPCDHAILEIGFEYIPADPDAPELTLSDEDEDRLEIMCKEMADDPDIEAIWTLRGRYG
ncbi:hypothetical protein FRB94_000200 [Tulasnella sp. JGI-2019a]|nr:hypothetical protein FRB94_000200 [Tulasnella sp. JGI-2019a]